jgi:hypothetical protein
MRLTNVQQCNHQAKSSKSQQRKENEDIISMVIDEMEDRINKLPTRGRIRSSIT